VLHRLDHPRDAERAKLGHRIGDVLDLEPEVGQRRRDLAKRRGRVEMVLQPGKRELHCAGVPGISAPLGISDRPAQGKAREHVTGIGPFGTKTPIGARTRAL
jgi:hypothetical protein